MLRVVSSLFAGSTKENQPTEHRIEHTSHDQGYKSTRTRRRRRKRPVQSKDGPPLNKAERALLERGEAPESVAQDLLDVQQQRREAGRAEPSPLSLPSLPPKAIAEAKSRDLVFDDRTNAQDTVSAAELISPITDPYLDPAERRAEDERANQNRVIDRQMEAMRTQEEEMTARREELEAQFNAFNSARRGLEDDRAEYNLEKDALEEGKEQIRKLQLRISTTGSGGAGLSLMQSQMLEQKQELEKRQFEMEQEETEIEAERKQQQLDRDEIDEIKKRTKANQKALENMLEDLENERAVNQKETLRIRREKDRLSRKKAQLRRIESLENGAQGLHAREDGLDVRAKELDTREDKYENFKADLDIREERVSRWIREVEQQKKRYVHDQDELEKDKVRLALKQEQLKDEAQQANETERHLKKFQQDLKERGEMLRQEKEVFRNTQEEERTKIEMHRIELNESQNKLELAKAEIEHQRELMVRDMHEIGHSFQPAADEEETRAIIDLENITRDAYIVEPLILPTLDNDMLEDARLTDQERDALRDFSPVGAVVDEIPSYDPMDNPAVIGLDAGMLEDQRSQRHIIVTRLSLMTDEEWSSYDQTRMGKIGYDEFKEILTTEYQTGRVSEAALRNAFIELDLDKDGFIDLKEFYAARVDGRQNVADAEEDPGISEEEARIAAEDEDQRIQMQREKDRLAQEERMEAQEIEEAQRAERERKKREAERMAEDDRAEQEYLRQQLDRDNERPVEDPEPKRPASVKERKFPDAKLDVVGQLQEDLREVVPPAADEQQRREPEQNANPLENKLQMVAAGVLLLSAFMVH